MHITPSMDHWQRIEAAIHGQPTDRMPIALWRHFPDDDLFADKLVAHTLAWQQRGDFDLVKFMPPGTYGVEDWGAVTAYRGAPNGAREVIQAAVNHTEEWGRIQPLDGVPSFSVQ
jgi:uroporphyrinogen decarboxylase